ncbi:hypothetical protein D3C79_469540 [compost metagenome]
MMESTASVVVISSMPLSLIFTVIGVTCCGAAAASKLIYYIINIGEPTWNFSKIALQFSAN